MLRSSGHGAGLVFAGWLGGGARCGLRTRGTFGPGSYTLFGTKPRVVTMPVRLDRDTKRHTAPGSRGLPLSRG